MRHVLNTERRSFIYLNVVREPVEAWICVLHSEEHIAPRYDPTLWYSFDPDGKTAIMFLTQRKEHLP